MGTRFQERPVILSRRLWREFGLTSRSAESFVNEQNEIFFEVIPQLFEPGVGSASMADIRKATQSAAEGLGIGDLSLEFWTNRRTSHGIQLWLANLVEEVASARARVQGGYADKEELWRYEGLAKARLVRRAQGVTLAGASIVPRWSASK